MQKRNCNSEHCSIQNCNYCFLAYEKSLTEWERMIERKKAEHDHWNDLLIEKKDEYINLVFTSEKRIKELQKILRTLKIKKK